MNCPSRADPIHKEGLNQNPDALNADATTRADLDHIANARLQRDHRIDPADALMAKIELPEHHTSKRADSIIKSKVFDHQGNFVIGEDNGSGAVAGSSSGGLGGNTGRVIDGWCTTIRELARRVSRVLLRYAKFVGPGFMVAVAYIDPGRHVFLRLSFRFQLPC